MDATFNGGCKLLASLIGSKTSPAGGSALSEFLMTYRQFEEGNAENFIIGVPRSSQHAKAWSCNRNARWGGLCTFPHLLPTG